MNKQTDRDQDESKGVVEETGGRNKTPVSLAGQSGHRDQDPLLKASDSDYPEPGQNEEHTGEPRGHNQLENDTSVNPEGLTQDQDPGFRQKQNQNKTKDDPLAA